MSDVIDRYFQVWPADLEDALCEPQEVQSQLIPVLVGKTVDYDILEDQLQVLFVHSRKQAQQALKQMVDVVED